jgi:alpha-beta hydrolase superfamily lysophospholipase
MGHNLFMRMKWKLPRIYLHKGFVFLVTSLLVFWTWAGVDAQPIADSDKSDIAKEIRPSNERDEITETAKYRDNAPTVSKSNKKQKKKYLSTPPCLSWINANVEPKAVLLCVHGLGLHNGTYQDFGMAMASEGFATYAVDVRGFGSWQEAEGRENIDFNGCLDDVYRTLKVIHRVHPKLPVFLLGESMGGAIAIRVTALHPDLVDGLISSVPSGDRFKQKKTELKVALHFLEGPNKKFDIGSQIVEQAAGDNLKLKEAWQSDPLARMNLSPRELMQFQRFMNENHDSAKQIKACPVLMVQGCEDKLVKKEGTVELFNELTTPDKELVLIKDGQHLIFEENQFSNDVIKTISAWLNSHLQRTNISQAPAVQETSLKLKP